MKKIALLVGVSNYEYPEALRTLPCACKDVEAVQRVLLHPQMGEFSEVRPLFDPDPMQMQGAIEELFRERTRDDLVLLFFSGHGVKDSSGKLYFATRITRKTQRGELLTHTAVPAQFVSEAMHNSRSKRQVLILDCCFSGAFDQRLESKDAGDIDLQAHLGAEGRVVLASSSSIQYSFEQKESDLSIYTRYLVEGIETGAADRDNDNKISARELHRYASSKVQETAPNMSPKIIVLKDDGFDIVIARAQIADPRLKYRKEAERYGSQGQISSVGRMVLNRLRTQIGLSESETFAIEEEVLQPYKERWENLQQYRDAFASAVQQEYPLSPESVIEFDGLQEVMGLRDQDVEPIKAEVLAQFTTQTVGYQQKIQQYEQVFSQTIQGEYPLSNSAREVLKRLKQSLELKDEDILDIENRLTEERQQEYKANMQQYEQEFLKAVQAEYPLSSQLLEELRSLQTALKLKDADVERLERPINEQKEIAFQKQQANNSNQQHVEEIPQHTPEYQEEQEQPQDLPLNPPSCQKTEDFTQEVAASSVDTHQNSPRDVSAASKKRQLLVGFGAILLSIGVVTGGIYWYWKQDLTRQQAALDQIKGLYGTNSFGECIDQAVAFTGRNSEIASEVNKLREACGRAQTQQDTLARIKTLKANKNYAECVSRASNFPDGKPEISDNAKELLGDCLLAEAEQLANQGNYVSAINKAIEVPSGVSAEIQAEGLINRWPQKIIEIATKKYEDEGDLENAVKIAKALPRSSSNYSEAEKLIKKWNAEWTQNQADFDIAQAALSKNQWEDAINSANRLTTNFWRSKAREIIEKANLELNRDRILDKDETLDGSSSIINGYRYEEFTFEGEKDQTVVITMESEDFDTNLHLYGPDEQKIISSDDDVQNSLNSAITIKLEETGTYRVRATTYTPGEQGSYHLSVRLTQ